MNETSISAEGREVGEKMDDNENYIEYSKMNFSQFTSPFSAGPLAAANQFAAKFPQNLSTTAGNGQVLGLLSGGGEGGVPMLRQVDGAAVSAASAVFGHHQSQQGQTVTAGSMQHAQMSTPAYITLPITMPGAKPGDAQQTVQIQVLNPNPLPAQVTTTTSGTATAGQTAIQTPKFQMGQMQIPIQGFQQGTTVLTVAYSPQDEEVIHNHGLPEGMTIVAALQPQDLQLLASQNAGTAAILQQQQQQAQSGLSANTTTKVDSENPPPLRQIKQESSGPLWNQSALVPSSLLSGELTELLQQQQQQSRTHNLNLQPYLKFNHNNNLNGNHPHLVLPSGLTIGGGTVIKQEITDDHSNENTQYGVADSSSGSGLKENGGSPGATGRENDGTEGGAAAGTNGNGSAGTGKARKKRKYKTKPPKPKRQKPGQVHITTALDGTVLFCCPECHMAYPEKECLEQHLVVHKIERRFICDICGAGLKRKEHLERHKLGHNPERPYICSVCMKGFKRKEHLNLHFVIHSGVKTEICNDCGKGFYRKDHLRKHIKSHLTRRLKEEKASSRNNNNNNNSNSNNRNNNSNGGTVGTTITPLSSAGATNAIISLPSGIPPGLTITTSSSNLLAGGQQPPSIVSTASATHNLLQSAISLPQGVTIHVPTADNQTLPVQITLPHLVAQQHTEPDGSTSTVLVPTSTASSSQSDGLHQLHHPVHSSSASTTSASLSSSAASL
ncbi:fez family zinc finger protein erm-like [Anopheles bellator]|uniref:fez family zinc finger protein erm-like n=1 Tax=Anopheles bellator TaxID=139047 RepID=UPI0026491295|nr:fez family zinc finger protein erm-like [Anopheles bellator]